MSHSHLPIRHLIRYLEKTRQERGPQPNSGRTLPSWLSHFIDRLADLFEPFSGIARVGYECVQGPESWEVVLFLGENETVGGPTDGQLTPVNFRFDLHQINGCFTRLETLYWNAFPHSHVCFEEQGDLAFVTATGYVETHKVSLQIQAVPPEDIGPGLKELSDGRVELF